MTYAQRRVQIQSWTPGAVRTKKRMGNLSQQLQEQRIKAPQSTWCTLHLWNTWIDNEACQIEEVDFGSNDIYIFFPFSLFVSVYVYASVCVCLYSFAFTICPRVLSILFFFFYLKNIFFLIFFYFNNYFILLYFILFYIILSYFIFFFLSFFSPFYSEPCGWQALGAPARGQSCATEVGEPSSGHWSTRDLPAPHTIKWRKSPRDLHLNAKTQLQSTTSKLQRRTSYVKQLPRQEHNPIH